MIDAERLEKLERLARLRDSGALSEDEFAAAKQSVLASAPKKAEKERLFGGNSLISAPASNGPVLLAFAAILLLALGVFLLLRSDRRSAAPSPDPAERAEVQQPTATAKVRPAPLPRQPPDLGRFLSFSDPSRCETADPLKSVVGGLWRYDEAATKIVGGGSVRVPGVGVVRPQFTRTTRADGGAEFESSLPLNGLWHGLRVSRIVDEGVEESDVGSFQIRFLESPERVREVLNRQGFRIPAVGQFRELDPDDEMSGSIWVKKVSGGSMLGCS